MVGGRNKEGKDERSLMSSGNLYTGSELPKYKTNTSTQTKKIQIQIQNKYNCKYKTNTNAKMKGA